jgi:uncharacterized alpha-E superfamily protein
VISRVADHCFWFGRYLDRTESSARLLQATRTLVFDADIPVTQCWAPLVIVSGEHARFSEHHGEAALGNGEVVQEYLTWSAKSPVSLRSSARAARDCARAIRDQLSLDVWEEVNELFHWLERTDTRSLYTENREGFYRSVRRTTQLTLGLVRSTMLHEEPMSFLWGGVMMERAGQTARILDMHHHTMEREGGHDIVQVALWLSLLRACSGAEAFMKARRGRVTAQSMLEFLLFADEFPRSLRYCLRSAHASLRRAWTTAGEVPQRHASVERLGALIDWLDHRAPSLDATRIHELLTHVVDETARVCEHVADEIQGPARPITLAPPAPPPQ